MEQIVEGITIGGGDNSDDDDDRRSSQAELDLKRKRASDNQQIPAHVPRRNKMPNLAHTVFITISLLSALAGALPVDEPRMLGIPTDLPSLGDVSDRFISKETIEFIGMIIGWFSALLYVLTTSYYIPCIY